LNPKAISRTSAGLVLIVIIVVGGLVGALYYYSTTPSPSEATTTVPARVPDFVKSSTYIYESGQTFQYLDPAISFYTYDAEIEGNVYEGLLRLNGNSSTEVIPWLAESYQQISPTKYQFKLRQNIAFQDGTPFNARAVWFGYNRLLMIDGTSGSGSHGIQAAWIIQQMLDTSLFSFFTPNQPYDSAWVQKVLALNFIEIVDPYTINMNIEKPVATEFSYLLTATQPAGFVSPSFVVSHDFPSACATPDCPADTIDYTAYFNHIAGHGEASMNYLLLPTDGAKAGTGPYYIDSVNPTTYEIILKANPNYWGGPKEWSGPPITMGIKTVDYVYQPDFATRLLDLRSGKASGIQVSAADAYSVVDRDQWLTNNMLVSTIPGVTVYGPFPQLGVYYVGFATNVTDTAGNVLKFQPFADIRFRLAVASAVNLTDVNISVNNKLGFVANEFVPPGTGPEGAYNPNIMPIYHYDLTIAEKLLVDAQKNPLKNFVDVNGHPYRPGVIDNSFGPDKPKTITFYAETGDTVHQKIFATIVSNLNDISTTDNLGLTFTIALIPGGQEYTLTAKHWIYSYAGSYWVDYNHVMDWMNAFAFPGGSTQLFLNWNLTTLNNLYWQGVEADKSGDVQSLLRIHNEAETVTNKAVMYMYTYYPEAFDVRTSYLRGYFFNPNTFPYYACMSYATD
jgi:ABC-type transport system substrate-binding protein